MNTFVYFVRPIGADGPVKIGCSTNPVNRLSTLMAWAPVPLEVVATLPGDLRLERRIHGLFAETHSHREWFHVSPRLTKLMADLASGKNIAELIDLSAPIGPFRVRNRRSDSINPERRAYLSYAARLRWAFKPLHDNDRRLAPNDVDEILEQWHGRPAQYGRPAIPVTPPTPEQLHRLEEVIAHPELHAITSSQKWPQEEEEAA